MKPPYSDPTCCLYMAENGAPNRGSPGHAGREQCSAGEPGSYRPGGEGFFYTLLRRHLRVPTSREDAEFMRILLEHFRLPEERRAVLMGGLHSLTPRQRQVLILLCRGCSLPEITAQLKISRFTAYNHARVIYEKLHLNSRAELQAALLGLGLPPQGRRLA